MAKTKTVKTVDAPRVLGVPTCLVTFNTVAGGPRPNGVSFDRLNYPQRDRMTYGFVCATDADAFVRALNSGAFSLFPGDVERRTFASRDEAIAVCNAMDKHWRY